MEKHSTGKIGIQSIFGFIIETINPLIGTKNFMSSNNILEHLIKFVHKQKY